MLKLFEDIKIKSNTQHVGMVIDSSKKRSGRPDLKEQDAFP